MLPKGQNLEEYNNTFLSTHKESVSHQQAGLTSRQLLKPESKPQCEQDLIATLDSKDITIDTALAGLELLGEWGSNQAAKSAYVEKASSKWPEATVFRLD